MVNGLRSRWTGLPRDARDTSRATAPLRAAADALELDNTQRSIEDSVEQVLAWWTQRQHP